MPRPIVILFLGRDAWQKDLELTTRIIRHLHRAKLQVEWEDPAGPYIYLLRLCEKRLPWLPGPMRNANLRLVQFLYGSLHWRYFRSRRRGLKGPIEIRCQDLSRTFERLQRTHDIVVLSRSSGGRVASLIADQFRIRQLICMGYPFRNPSHGDEPSRYTHLAHLRTPFLILQGTRDIYGHVGDLEHIPLSDQVRIVSVQTGHDFEMSDAQFQETLELLLDTIHGGTPSSAGRDGRGKSPPRFG